MSMVYGVDVDGVKLYEVSSLRCPFIARECFQVLGLILAYLCRLLADILAKFMERCEEPVYASGYLEVLLKRC